MLLTKYLFRKKRFEERQPVKNKCFERRKMTHSHQEIHQVDPDNECSEDIGIEDKLFHNMNLKKWTYVTNISTALTEEE